jgi:hypothetical protein
MTKARLGFDVVKVNQNMEQDQNFAMNVASRTEGANRVPLAISPTRPGVRQGSSAKAQGVGTPGATGNAMPL